MASNYSLINLTHDPGLSVCCPGVVSGATDFDETLSSSEVTDIISSQYEQTRPATKPAVVELTPVVPSFRRKRRKINSPIYLGTISGKSRRSNCDEDNINNKGEVRDEEVVVKEMISDPRMGQIHAEFGLPEADLHLKMNTSIKNKMRVSRSQGHSTRNLSKNSAGTSKLDSSDSVENFDLISAARTTVLQGDDCSLLRATSKIYSHDVIQSSSSSISLTSSRGCSRKKKELGRKEQEKKYDDAHSDVGVIDQRTVTGSDKKASLSSREGTIASHQLKRSSRLMLKNASIPLQPSIPILQLSVDTPSSIPSSKVSRMIRPSLTNNSATLSVDNTNTEDYRVRVDLEHSHRPSRENATYGCGAVPSDKSHSSSGCTGGAPEGSSAEDAGQHTGVFLGPLCNLSPPKTGHEGHVSLTATADGSRCIRSSKATASPLRSVMKKHPSTSRSRKLSSLSLASVSALNSHVTNGPNTSNISKWVDPKLIKVGRLGVEGRGRAMEGSELVPIRSLVTVSVPPSRTSLSQRFSRSASAPFAFSTTSSAKVLSVPSKSSLTLSPPRDYRHSSFRARKMLEAAKEIVVRNHNEQHRTSP